MTWNKNYLLNKFLIYLILFSWISVKANSIDTTANLQASPIIFQQSPDGDIKQNFYHHKLLILDFWATWCAPCIAGFPHFNQLSDKYSSDKVIFAAISNESLQSVQKYFFRTGKKLNAIKLIDTTSKTMNEYGVLTSTLRIGIPYCVIIDEKNILRWTGNTYNLTDEILDKIIDGKSAQIVQIAKLPPQRIQIITHDFFSFNVARSDTGKLTAESGETYRTYKTNIVYLKSQNQSLAEMIELISGFSKQRFTTNDISKLEQHIDLNYDIGTDSSQYKAYNDSPIKSSRAKNFVINLLGDAFKFTTHITTQKNKHFELIVIDTSILHSFRSLTSRHHSYDFDHAPNVEIIGYNLNNIATYLESDAKIIITSRILDKSLYDFSLDVSSIEVLNNGLKFHGLKLVEVNDYVDLMDIEFY